MKIIATTAPLLLAEIASAGSRLSLAATEAVSEGLLSLRPAGGPTGSVELARRMLEVLEAWGSLAAFIGPALKEGFPPAVAEALRSFLEAPPLPLPLPWPPEPRSVAVEAPRGLPEAPLGGVREGKSRVPRFMVGPNGEK